MTAIRAEGLYAYYGTAPAVNGLDLTVPTGSVYGFLGPNGAGKTTTINMLTTLLRPTAGRAEVAGFDVAARPAEVRRRIGIVFQESTSTWTSPPPRTSASRPTCAACPGARPATRSARCST